MAAASSSLDGPGTPFWQMQRARRQLELEVEKIRRSFRAELVPYQAPGSALVPARDVRGARGVGSPGPGYAALLLVVMGAA